MAAKRILVVWAKVSHFSTKYPVVRGMASYAVIWPIGSLLQQHIEGREEYDYWRVARFCLYGSCYVAPTLNLWMKLAVTMWPKQSIPSAFSKALVEQVSYTPFAMTSFYFIMSLLEGKSAADARHEVADKFWPTFQVGACVWPILQMLNYTLVAEKNRVVFVSFCSLIWTTFLAYMKHLEGSHFKHPLPFPSYLQERLASPPPLPAANTTDTHQTDKPK